MGLDTALSPTEGFILLAAAYLHDIGMQDERSGNGSLERIREQHHKLTAQIIRDNSLKRHAFLSLGLEGIAPDIVEKIALVAEAHRRTDLTEDRYSEFIYGDKMLRPRLLAALLRLADELDIDHRRVHLELLDLMNVPVKSRLHWFLCHYVSGVQIVDGRIVVWYRYPERHDDYPDFLIPLVTDKIRPEFEGVKDILWDHGVRLTLSESQVRSVACLKCMPPDVEELARKEAKLLVPERQEATYTRDVTLTDGPASTFDPGT